jgi:hypothetical protein
LFAPVAKEALVASGMASPVWQLAGHDARLQVGRLEGAIDLSRPAHGLVALRLEAESLGDARLLGIETPLGKPGGTGSPIECYVRGADLVAAYQESDTLPVRVDALWRAEAPSASNGPLAVLELVVSVRTDLADSRPELSVHSALPATERLRLVDEQAARFDVLGPAGKSNLDPAAGPGCVLFRLPASRPSYAEMIHPLDFHRDELTCPAASCGAAVLRHRLFPEPFEKGVILRARLRGVLLPQSDDKRMAADSYAAFAAEEPPLGA